MVETKEIWKDCIHYEGLYQISNKGRVWDINNQTVLKPYETSGYLTVYMKLPNGKVSRERIHRLVALNFVTNPKPNEYNCVNHLDEDKHNNCSDNLEWCTLGMNISYSKRRHPDKHPMKGKHHSEETKHKMSEAAKGKPKSEEHKKHISEGNKGRIVTEETRAKISASEKVTKSKVKKC